MLLEQASCSYSIVIPTYSRPERLRICLESLTRLKSPEGGFEVVVVDDGSPQPLQPVVADFASRLLVTCLRQENAGPATARNFGASRARGKYLVFVDDDCCVDADWLVAFQEAFAGDPDGLVGGHTINGLPKNRYSAASQFILDLVYAHYNPSPDAVTFLASNNIAMPAKSFHELGGFDAERFSTAGGEDRDLCDRWTTRFGTMRRTEKAIVRHYHSMNLRSFWRQNYTYGRGAWTFHRIRSEAGRPRLHRDARFHCSVPRLLTRRLSRESWRSALSVLPLLFVWQIANASGFFCEGLRNGWTSSRRTKPTNGPAEAHPPAHPPEGGLVASPTRQPLT
jgi:glycosyltransferase involved in cell wall biosynthesis